MRSMPPNATPQASGMINMHHPQVHPQQQQPHQAQQQQQQQHQQQQQQQTLGNPQTAAGHKQAKRVAVKLAAAASRPGSQDADQQWGQQDHVGPARTQQQAQAQAQAQPQSGSNFVPESPSLLSSSAGAPPTSILRDQQRHGSSSQATISGLNSNQTASTNSNTPGAVVLPLAPPPAPLGGPNRDEMMDDLSECSCSSSLDCSLDEPSHSASSHLEQPLLGPGGHMAPPGPLFAGPYLQHPHPIHSQHPHHNNRSHHHHQHHHHNRQHHHHHDPVHGLQPHDVYRGQPPPPNQHHYYHKRDMPVAGHPPQHYHPDQGRQALYKPQVHHRPLLARTSMPPSLSNAAHQQPQPPPLFRHSTYATTSDTLTDESPHHTYYRQEQPQPQPQPQPQSQQQHHYGMTPPPPSNAALGHATHQMAPAQQQQHDYFSAGPTNETDLLIGESSGRHRGHGAGGRRDQQQETNFKRSATTREPDSHRWRTEGPRQQTYSASDATNTLSLERNGQLGQREGSVAGGSLQRPGQGQLVAHSRLAAPGNSTQSVGHKTTRRQQQMPVDEAGQQASASYQVYSQQEQHQQQQQPPGALGSRAQSSLGVSTTNGTSSAHLMQVNSSLGGNLLLGANSASTPAMARGAGPFEAGAATFCSPVLPPLPPPIPAAIPSHRTNSPWMRLSGIILTPVGIVIVLFIVISPLLHYLM